MYSLPAPFVFVVFLFAGLSGATTGWVNRQQQAVIDYLLEENRVLRAAHGPRRLHVTNDQRRRLAVKGKVLGRRRLAAVAGIVTPDTILRWYRTLVAKKYDGSKVRRGGRPSIKADLAALVVRMATENPTWGYSHDRVRPFDHPMLRVVRGDDRRSWGILASRVRRRIDPNRRRDRLDNLPALREKLIAATDRLAGFEAEMLNVHVDFPVFQRLALPITVGHTRIPGIKIHETRMMRLLEVLLHAGPQLAGWPTATIHGAVCAAFGLTADQYSLTQLRYDLRKGLLERLGRTYAYRLTKKGIQVGALFILFHKRICGPLANSLFQRRPEDRSPQPAKIEQAYHHADAAVQHLIDLLAA